jgi:hypothetical protein
MKLLYDGTLLLILLGIIIGLSTCSVAMYIEHTLTVKQAIDHNCGRFNPENGKFEWIDAT